MDTTKVTGKVTEPIDFTPDTIQGVLPKEFALELVRRYKEIIAPRFDPAMKVMMFGSYAKDCPNEWSDIDVAVIVPKVDRDNWWETAVSLGRATRNISCYIEPILLESGEDSPIYREVMRTGVGVYQYKQWNSSIRLATGFGPTWSLRCLWAARSSSPGTFGLCSSRCCPQ